LAALVFTQVTLYLHQLQYNHKEETNNVYTALLQENLSAATCRKGILKKNHFLMHTCKIQ